MSVLARAAILQPNTTAAEPITFVPNLKYNWTEESLCAYLQFMPDSELATPDEYKWETTFPNQKYSAGAVGQGKAYHVVNAEKSQKVNGNGTGIIGLLTPFIGTGLSFEGVYSTRFSAPLPPVFKIDSSALQNATATTGGNLDTANFSLPWGAHLGVLTTVNGVLQVMSATWELGIQTEVSTWADVPYFTMPFVSGGEVNPAMELGNGAYGNTTFWSIKDSIGINHTYLRGNNIDSVLFNVAANTTLMVVRGLMGPEFGWGTFLIDPLPPGWPASEELAMNTFFATNAWYHPNSTLFLVTLDPTKKYQCLIQAAGEGASTSITGLGLETVTFYSSKRDPDWSGLVGTSSLQTPQDTPRGATTTSSNKNGVIAGAVIGGVIGLLIVFAAIGLYVWSVKRRLRRPGPAGPGILDEGDGEGEGESAEPHTGSGFVISPLPMSETAPVQDAKMRERDYHSRSSSGNIMTEFALTDGDGDTGSSPRTSRQNSRHDGLAIPIVQEADAGRYVHMIPPQYDPRWRDSNTSGGSDISAGLTGSVGVPRDMDAQSPTARRNMARKSVSASTTEGVREVPAHVLAPVLTEHEDEVLYTPVPLDAARRGTPLQLHNPHDPRRTSTVSSMSSGGVTVRNNSMSTDRT